MLALVCVSFWLCYYLDWMMTETDVEYVQMTLCCLSEKVNIKTNYKEVSTQIF